MRRLTLAVTRAGATRRAFGQAATRAQVAEALGLEESAFDHINPRVRQWVALNNVSRQAHQKLLASVPSEVNLASLLFPQKAAPTTKQALSDAKDIPSLVVSYASILLPARTHKATLNVKEIEAFGFQDILKRGLSAFRQEELNEAQKKLTALQEQMKTASEAIAKVGADNFTTASFNELINVMRLAAEHNPSARDVAVQMLEDMSLLGVAADEATALLMRNVVFGDGPLDDSMMLFACVEYPERGEVSASSGSLQQIRDEALQSIAERHQNTLDQEGLMMEHDATHPCLPRSSA